jgi:hypothetical protein
MKINWGFVAVLLWAVQYYYPKPTDLHDALWRAREVVVPYLPDAPITVERVFDDMLHANDCGTMPRVAVMNTSLTPGTGELRFS